MKNGERKAESLLGGIMYLVFYINNWYQTYSDLRFPLQFRQHSCKPGSVPCKQGVCHLSGTVVTNSLEQSTPRHRTGRPTAPVYMILQPIGCTATCVTTSTGEPLPHLFTLTPANRSGHFLLHYPALTNSFPLGNMVPCVARTFLFAKTKRQTGVLIIFVQR